MSVLSRLQSAVALAAPPEPPPGKGPEWGKAAPIGLLVILLLCAAMWLLFRNMSKHLRKVREMAAVEAAEAAQARKARAAAAGGAAAGRAAGADAVGPGGGAGRVSIAKLTAESGGTARDQEHPAP